MKKILKYLPQGGDLISLMNCAIKGDILWLDFVLVSNVEVPGRLVEIFYRRNKASVAADS